MKRKAYFMIAILVLGLAAVAFAQSNNQTMMSTNQMMNSMMQNHMMASAASPCPYMQGAVGSSKAANATKDNSKQPAQIRGGVDYSKNPYWNPKDWDYIADSHQ